MSATHGELFLTMKLLHVLALGTSLILSTPLFSAEYANVSPETDALIPKAHQNDSAAMEKLGDIYAEGSGVTKDRDEAMRWYALASQLGNESANDKLWEMEGHAKRKVKRIKRVQGYDKQATHDLCTYLYLTTSGNKNSLYSPDAVPKGIKTYPASMGKVMIDEYKPAIVKRYLKKGADPRVAVKIEDIKRPLGGTGHLLKPFAMISKMQDLKTLDLLIAHGCCINQHGNALVHHAFHELDRGDARQAKKLLKFLSDRGLNLNMRTNWSSTRLIDCACVDFAKGVTYLSKKGLDPNAELELRYLLDGKIRNFAVGDRALGMAVRNKKIYTIDALLKAGAEINYIYRGKTVLDEALAAPGQEDASAPTYEEEFQRLETIAYGTAKERKQPGADTRRSFPKTNDISVAHLLRLAGAKTAAELGHTPANQ